MKKSFIIGFLMCLLLATTTVYGASIIKQTYFNEGLKLAVNNQTADVRFVTVELEGEQYGRNYVSVADFVKALNDYAGLNATVDFDPKTQTILVSTKVSTPTIAPTPTPSASSTIEPVYIHDIKLIFTYDVQKKLEAKGYNMFNSSGKQRLEIWLNGKLILDDIPFDTYNSKCYFKYDYYVANLLPLIQ